MSVLEQLALVFVVGGGITFVATLAIPTRSALRQALYVGGYAVTTILSALYLTELYGWTEFVPAAMRDYVILAVPVFVALAITVITIDLYLNFDTLKDDPAYALAGPAGLAVLMLGLSVVAQGMIALTWHTIDPTIYERRANLVALTTADETLQLTDHFLFALDQSQKALLLDISEVYRFGIIDLGNNPRHLTFSTACLIYRTYLSGFVLIIVLRLMRRQRPPG